MTRCAIQSDLHESFIMLRTRLLFVPAILLVMAIFTGATNSEKPIASLLLKITGPTEAKVGSPVVIRIETPEASIETVKKGFSPSDTWLELYEKDGTPVRIFWSEVAGTRHLIIFAAVNGVVTPKTAVAEYTLEYNSDPLPPPNPNPVPEPSPDLKVRVGSLLSYVAASNISKGDITKVATFYIDFSEAIKNNNTTIATTSDFRSVYVEAGKKVLGGDLKGKYTGFGAIIDKVIMVELGHEVVEFTADLRNRSAALFQAIAWAIYEGSK